MIESMSLSKLPDYRFMGVYYIQNLASNKFYVGSSFDVYSRIKSHLNLLQRNCHTNIHMQRSYNKHGQDKFAWGICEEVFDIDQLLTVEQVWIDVMGDYNICTEAGVSGDLSRHERIYHVYAPHPPLLPGGHSCRRETLLLEK